MGMGFRQTAACSAMTLLASRWARMMSVRLQQIKQVMHSNRRTPLGSSDLSASESASARPGRVLWCRARCGSGMRLLW